MLLRVIMSICFSFYFCNNLNAQVAIGHTNPEAMLDVKSTNSGVLFPRILLTRTDVSAPVISPTNSEMVFNVTDNSSDNSIPELYRVTPGFYYWSASKNEWVRVYDDETITGFSKTYVQTNEVRIQNLNQYYPVPGLNQTFQAPHDGVYQVILTASYCTGRVDSTGDSVGVSAGRFKLDVNGDIVRRVVSARSFSIYTNSYTTDYFEDLVQWVTIVKEVQLLKGQSCNIQTSVSEYIKQNLDGDSKVGKNTDVGYKSSIQVVYITN